MNIITYPIKQKPMAAKPSLMQLYFLSMLLPARYRGDKDVFICKLPDENWVIRTRN